MFALVTFFCFGVALNLFLAGATGNLYEFWSGRLSFNKTVVTRYRIYLEDRLLAPGTINVRLAAVRRLAYEAADTGLLSPDLAAGIRRVKGAKKLGMRLGNWLTVDEARALWQLPSILTVKGRRDRAICGSTSEIRIGCFSPVLRRCFAP